MVNIDLTHDSQQTHATKHDLSIMLERVVIE